MEDQNFINTTGRPWERIYLSSKNFVDDYEIIFEEYKSTYNDAGESDFISDCISFYKVCLDNVRMITIYQFDEIYSRLIGDRILDEVLNFICENGEIIELKRKNAEITFKAIIRYLTKSDNPKLDVIKW